MHADLLDSLTKVANVRLISAFADPRLGFPDPNTLHVFVPDVHLISKQRQKTGGFKFSTNYPDLLTRVLKNLRTFKLSGQKEKRAVFVYQVGDLLDLWRETPILDALGNAVANIEDDFGKLMSAFTDTQLEAQFLLGNHDFDLYRLPNYRQWERRFYLPDYRNPCGIVLHGDIFDWLEKLPDAMQQMLVYYFAPQVSPGNFSIGQDQVDRFVHQFNGTHGYQNYIQAEQSLKIGQFADPATAAPFNVFSGDHGAEDKVQFLDKAREICGKADDEFEIKLNLAIIGHTHHPRIAYKEDGNGLFVLLDCGAWIESCCTDADPTPVKSAHLAALSKDEIRLYQLDPKPAA
jgi:UDP-2,3-diacylglucosamine pyrophosphatase LpxH